MNLPDNYFDKHRLVASNRMRVKKARCAVIIPGRAGN